MADLTCSRCGETKPADDFYWKNQARGYRQSCCKSCNKMASTRWRKANLARVHAAEKALRDGRNRDKQIRLRLRRSARDLGFDPDVIEAHYESHNGLCDCCGRPPSEAVQPKNRLSIDHNHVTGKFRGLLCHDCNLGIGMFGDSAKRLLAAAEYVESRA
jgi:hypothetical protein